MIFRALKRLWIPLVILIVVGTGAFTVARLHGVFGSEKPVSYSDTAIETDPVNPAHLRYEIFGPPGTVAALSFFDGNGDLQRLKGVHLPWSLEFPIMPATVGGNIVAQGNTDSLGCRILVDGVVKDEQITHAVSAFTFCRQKLDD